MTKSFVFRIYLCFFNKSIVLCLIYTSERLLLFYNSFWLYTLQLYIAGNFQVVRSHYLAKKSYIYLNISRILRFRFLFFHFFSLWQMPFYLVGYTKWLLHFEQPTVLLARRDLNTMCLTNFENVSSILNIFQEKHDFLVLTDPVIICIYLRTTDRHLSY